MKITYLTLFAAIILGIISVVFAGSVSWSLSRLNQDFSMVETYGALKEQVIHKIELPIVNYLHSGDASLLTSIQKNIQDLKSPDAGTGLLEGQVKTAFVTMLDTLEHSFLQDLREAGKLADPQVLLINNEEQLTGEISALADYVEKAAKASPTTRAS